MQRLVDERMLLLELDCDIVVGAGFTREPPANVSDVDGFCGTPTIDQSKGISLSMTGGISPNGKVTGG